MVGTVGVSSPRGDPCSSTSVAFVRVDILSKEYPPQIYGGAGVHVAELVRALRARGDIDARVRCFGGPRDEPGTTGYDDVPQLASANATVQTLGVDLQMAGDCVGADLVHSHTWYANMAGHLGSLLAGIPHVVSAHSLEPLRPWKAEQLGGGYAVSSWVERTAYEAAAGIIAVSAGMRADVLKSYPAVDPAKVHVVHNGIDSRLWTARRGPRRRPPPRRRPRPALGRLRRADHPPEGAAVLPARRPGAAAGGADRAVRRRSRHPGDQGRGRGADRRACARRAAAWCGSPRCCRGRRSSPC